LNRFQTGPNTWKAARIGAALALLLAAAGALAQANPAPSAVPAAAAPLQAPAVNPEPAATPTQPAQAPGPKAKAGDDALKPGSLGGDYLLQTTLGLLFVLGLLLALAWVLKRSGFSAQGRNNQFYKILAVSALGPKERIALMEVGDTWLVVGMTSTSMNTLHTMPKGSLEFDPQASAAATFAKLLERVKKPSKSL